MNRNQIKGRFAVVAGRLQQLVGEMTGSARLQVKGEAAQVEGKVQWDVGDVEAVVALRSSKRRVLQAR